MDHLTMESLARLVDERPSSDERNHLAACEVCTADLEALREQTASLRSLPEIMPPRGDWRALEDRLRSEGLVSNRAFFERLGLARTPVWMKAAAAVLLFLSGAGAGAALTSAGATGASPFVDADASSEAEVASVEEAASAVRMAEERYVSAVSRYRQMLGPGAWDAPGTDPISRVAALEHLVMVSQAALRQAPGDPFINGFLASAMAERDAALRMVSTNQDNWF